MSVQSGGRVAGSSVGALETLDLDLLCHIGRAFPRLPALILIPAIEKFVHLRLSRLDFHDSRLEAKVCIL